MIKSLTRNPAVRAGTELVQKGIEAATDWRRRHSKGGLALKVFMGAYLGGLALVFAGTLIDYGNRGAAAGVEGGAAALPSMIPILFQGLALMLAFAAFLVVLWVGKESTMDRRRNLVVVALALASLAGLAAWLPSDVIATRAAILGSAPAGETPSIPAYIGMLLLVSLLILSVPVVALVYFRLDLMDRYVLQNFMLPFFFCLLSFMAIWILGDLSNNGNNFAGLSAGRVLTFYVVQVPFVVLFVMPIAVMLSGLYALGKMSKSNEFISMIGAGRSVPRILAPLFIAGVYVSLVGLAFKYQWAPASVGYKEAIMEGAKREQWVKKQGGGGLRDELWAKRGWMHVDRAEKRTWFVGRVPLKLSDEMADVVVTQLDDQAQPVKMWIARRAHWVWDEKPPKWVLQGVRVYTYDANHIPRIQVVPRLELTDWSETPWKVLSSSQNPEYLGIPGLTMYLNANGNLDTQSLAPFRTNWWNIFAEPMACISMILVAAPLGIVYSRRGAMGGITAAIGIFAMMYVLNGTFIAMGHTAAVSPFVAAWTTNVIVACVGLVLLWYRAKNRDLPTLKSLFAKPRRSPLPGTA